MDRAGSLRTARQLMGMAADRLAQRVDSTDDMDAREAVTALAGALMVVDSVLAGGHWWLQRCIEAVLVGAAVWAAAAVSGQALGLGPGWTITVALATAAVASSVARKVQRVAGRAVERRRVRRTASAVRIPPGMSADAELLGLLKLARGALAEAAADLPRTAGLRGAVRSFARFVWLRDYHQRWHFISNAERYVCRSITSIERWLITVQDAR